MHNNSTVLPACVVLIAHVIQVVDLACPSISIAAVLNDQASDKCGNGQTNRNATCIVASVAPVTSVRKFSTFAAGFTSICRNQCVS